MIYIYRKLQHNTGENKVQNIKIYLSVSKVLLANIELHRNMVCYFHSSCIKSHIVSCDILGADTDIEILNRLFVNIKDKRSKGNSLEGMSNRKKNVVDDVY